MILNKPITSAWVVFPEYTQWENRKNKLYWEEDFELEETAEFAFRFSWKKPATTRRWNRPIGKGDFVLVSNMRTSQWLKLASAKNGKRIWVWSDWDEVFGEEATVRKKINKTLLDLES